ncbi:MAG: cation-transporting P-type ATPase, partial [Candidatus Omnitrophica bacterium]|nr:cation-transporting P-type ATPase [Candidatus Omnitrophota bacterium]
LTKNEMTVRKIYADGKVFSISGAGYSPEGDFFLNDKIVRPDAFPGLDKALNCAIICNSAKLVKNDDRWQIIGDPTEGALLTAGAKAKKFKEAYEKEFEIIDEIPFDSERKRMTVIIKQSGSYTAFIKGAPDVLIKLCSYTDENGKIKPMNDKTKEEILSQVETFTRHALRVLATGYKKMPLETGIKENIIEKDIIFTGLFAMSDPPRKEAKIAIEKCKKAGIKVKMITGDHKLSAAAIAKELSLITDEANVISGEQIDATDDSSLKELVNRMVVFARVSPHHKLRIVRALKNNKEIVAMTGDGVNDAPALKEADIGVAMGITGTDVTKEVSDMVITDDNFASIVAAVEEGRGIYENIKKFVHFLLSCNAGEIMVMFFASIFGMPIPLLPAQILWINIVTDGFPALALGVDPVDPDNMKKPPREPDQPLIDMKTGKLIIFQGAIIALCTLLVFSYALFVENAGITKARTMAFFVLATSQLFHSFNLRSNIRSIFDLKFFSNAKLVYAVAFSFLLQVSVIYLPAAQNIFRTTVIENIDLLIVIVVSTIPLWVMEVLKLIVRRKKSDSGV